MNKLTKIALVLIIIGVIGSLLTIRSARDTSDWETIEQSFPAHELVNIDIESTNAKVEILPTTDEDITVSYSNENAKEHFTADVNDSTLFIRVNYKKGFSFRFFPEEQLLTVHLPKKTYDQIKVMNNNGYLDANQVEAADIRLSTNNGKVIINEAKASMLHAESNNGSIQLSHVTTEQVDVRTKNGKIELHEVSGGLTGQTNNGEIKLVTTSLEQMIDFTTDNGTITIETEQEPTNAILDLRTNNGRIKVFGQSDWDTVIGNGEHVVKLTSKNGNITITN